MDLGYFLCFNDIERGLIGYEWSIGIPWYTHSELWSGSWDFAQFDLNLALYDI
jgi:hypothetical protein